MRRTISAVFLMILSVLVILSIQTDKADDKIDEQPGTVTFGETTAYTNVASVNDYIRYYSVYINNNHDVYLNNITCYLYVSSTSDPPVKCAIYQYVSDTNVGNLIEESEVRSINSDWAWSWQTFNFSNEAILTKNTWYTICAWAGTYTTYAGYTTGGNGGYVNLAYGTFPSPLTSEVDQNRNYSIYISCTNITNDAPYQTSVSPADGSTGADFTPYLYVTCADNESSTMNATWWSNSSGSWVQFASNSSIYNNTQISQHFTNATDDSTTYYWSVNLSDGSRWCNNTYHFRTVSYYYVNGTSGSDNNNGTLAYPFKTIEKVCNVSSNGDTVYIMTGSYTPTSQISISNKNTANEWLVIRNYNNDYVEVNGSNCPTSSTWNSSIEIVNSKYVRISGITVNHSKKGGIAIKSDTGQEKCSFINVDNCSINNCSSWAIKVTNGMNNITFEHNYLYDNFNNWSGISQHQETVSFENVTTFSINNNTLINNRHLNIDVKGGCSSGEICYNEINTTAGYLHIVNSDCWGSGAIYLDTRGDTDNISIFNNLCYGNNTGIEINGENMDDSSNPGHFEYIYIYNNICDMDSTGGAPSSSGRGSLGLSFTGYSDASEINHHVYIYSNTFYQDAGNGNNVLQIGHYVQDHFGGSSRLQDVYVENNIFYTENSSGSYTLVGVNKIAFENGTIVMNNNSFYRPSGTIRIYWNGTSYTSSSSPQKFGTDPVFEDPSFVDGSADNFHLTSASPCRDVGNSTLVPSFDFDGLSRPQGAGYDIGAFEFSFTPYVYTFNPIITFRVLPNTQMPDEYLSNEMTVASCPGEYNAATFVVTPNQNVTALLPTADDLTCGELTINKSFVDIKVVKCWYQMGDDIVPSSPTDRLYIPELLLNDDDLIRTTYISNTSGWNQLNTTEGYIDINNKSEGSEYAEIYDSATLLPVDVPANTNKQFWVTVHVPEGTTAGTYNGLIHLMNGDTEIGQVNLTVKVLPFTLPVSPIINSIYYTQVLSSNNTASLNAYGRNQTQLHAEMKGMKEHGILYPIIDGQNYLSSSTRFNTFMQIWAAEGLNTSKMYYASGTIPSDPYFTTVPLIQTNVPKIINYLRENYSTNDVYFYGVDETDQVPYAEYLLAARGVGAKTMDAQDRETATTAINYDPPLLNLSVMAGHPDASIIARYHGENLSIGSYGNPQAGEEKPLTYRTNYGLLLWQYDVDVASTFAYAYGNSTAPNRLLWNDWNWGYKAEVFAYPTTDGVVNTIEYEGFREGVNDVRYLSKLEAVCSQAISEGREMYDAEAYIANLKNWNITVPSEIDVALVRSEVISYIEEYYENLTTHLISPVTQTTVDSNPDCVLQVNDTEGHSLIVDFYENSTGTWIQRQNNITSANSTVRWNYNQASSPGVTYWWKATVYDGITNISHIYSFTVDQDLIYGMISDNIISTFTGDDSPSAVSPHCVRINNSEYYLIASSLGSNLELNVLRICNYSGRIQHNIISWFDLGSAASGACPIVVQVPDTDKYAVVYRDAVTNLIGVATVRVWDTNGTIQQSVIDFQALTYNGYDANMIAVTDNVFVIAYYHNVSHNGYLETIWINQSGTINDTLLSTVQYSSAQGASPHILLLDSDTIALNYVSPGTNGMLKTYNITSSGIITSTYSSSWEYETYYCLSTSIAKVSGDVYAISYSGENYQYYGNIKTLVINSTTGIITKSFIDTLVFDANNANYSTLLKIQPGVFAIAYKGTDGIGMLKTVNITDAGQIDIAPIDSLVFDATQCTGSAYITYVNQSYYFIVYERYWYTGFGSTVTIETRCLIAPNGFSAFASGRFQINLVWMDDTEADSTRVEWYTSSDDSWDVGDHNLLYNGSAESTSQSGLDAGTTRYYKAWSWNLTDGVWSSGATASATTNNNTAPSFGSLNPDTGSTGVSASTSSLSVSVVDSDGDTFNWTIETSPNIGNSSGNNTTNGTKTCSVSGLAYSTTYTWHVNATDGNASTNGTYTFTTESEPSNPPSDGGYTPPTKPQNKAPTAKANGPYTGYINQIMVFNGSGSSDPENNTLTYIWNFGDGNNGTGKTTTHSYNSTGVYNITLTVSDGSLTDNDTTTANINEETLITDTDGDGWSDEIEISYETNITDPNNYPVDTDKDRTPDDNSSDGKYIGDTDDDDDGLNDETEIKLGSDSKNNSDVKEIDIEGAEYYLIEINRDGTFDNFYNPYNLMNTSMGKQPDGTYLIDSNGDENWDYIYNPASETITVYKEKPSEEFPWLIMSIIGIIIAVIVILFLTGYIRIEIE